MKLALSFLRLLPPEISHFLALHALKFIYKANLISLFFPYDNSLELFQFKGLTKPPAFRNFDGLNLIVQVPELGSLMKGSPVFYRQVPVGNVTNFDLPAVGQHVNVFVNIHPEYTSYVRADSEFENISGVRMDLSLFGGLKIRAESLETIVGGGLSFTSPANSPKAASGAVFILKDD